MLNLKITTPEGETFNDVVDSITIPTKMGEITILPNHIPLVSAVMPGEIIARKKDKEEYLSVSTGFVEVSNNNVTLLADTAEMVDTLVEEEILRAKERAEKLLTEKRQESDVAFAEVAAILEREVVRLKVYRRRRHGNKNLEINN
ncbi:MAG: ATP synthase F1 subunit epsilon [Parcubacteria group bacterium CG10_big_fil_rev_8_21_14_0_10_36_14]|nr:MAG: ATP synthase F1 subunit epsilon [Parcubacteria group bacterium CG10_big_fil_rev_8_21_14_0_10_36_14]